MTFRCPPTGRIQLQGYPLGDERNGAFVIKLPHQQSIKVIASDGMGWEHVSVSRKDRVPSWDEMCRVKNLFWDIEDCVIQFHPPLSNYINNHPNCLHLWRPIGFDLPMPDALLVGI